MAGSLAARRFLARLLCLRGAHSVLGLQDSQGSGREEVASHSGEIAV